MSRKNKFFHDIKKSNWPFANLSVPIIDWFPFYTTDDLLNDSIAGLTLFVILIPSGIAYSLLAGLPPIYGLYSATIPSYIYAILGTSREMSMGPHPIISQLLMTSAISLGYPQGSFYYIPAIMNLTMLSGIILFLLGICKLGVMANFLSYSVLIGFTTGSALLIALSQIKHILGFKVPSFEYTHDTIIYIFSHLYESNPISIIIGTATLILLYGINYWKKKNKPTKEKLANFNFKVLYMLSNLSTLFILKIGAIIAYTIVSNGYLLQILGNVPAGLQPPNFAFFSINSLISMFPSAFIIAILTFSFNWAIATRFAAMHQQHDYDVNATQELMASGLMNILGSFFNCYMASGGFTRTVVSTGSGAKSQMSGVISATLLIFAIELCTRIFYYIPIARVIGAIIEINVISLMDFNEMIKSYHIDRHDCVVMWVTFISTFFLGITQGIFIGIVLSIAFVMNSSAFPLVSHLGKLPDEDGGYFADVSRFPNAQQIPHIAIVRMDTTLYFANIHFFKETVLAASRGLYHTSLQPIHLIIFDATAWNDVDLSGINTLQEIHNELIMKSIQLAFVCSKGRLRDRLETAHFIEKLGEQYFYMTIEDAIRALPIRRATIAFEQAKVESNESITMVDILSNSTDNGELDYTYNVILQDIQNTSSKSARSHRSSSL